MTITIYTNGHIGINGFDTGLAVSQERDGTEVYSRELMRRQDVVNGQVVWLPAIAYKKHAMPHQRYVLASDGGNGKNPGRKQFEQDVLALIDRLNEAKLPDTLRKKAQGKAIVNLSAKQINELADYIEKLQKQIKDEKCK